MGDSVATLSTSGFIDDPYYKADRLLAYFFSSDASQSNDFPDKVASLPALIKTYGDNSLGLQGAIQTALTTMFQPHFDNVDLRVKVERVENTTSIDENIIIDALVIEAGQTYTVGKLINVVNSVLEKVTDIVS